MKGEKKNLRALSRVIVMSVCHPLVDSTESIFFGSSRRLVLDIVRIKTEKSSCIQISHATPNLRRRKHTTENNCVVSMYADRCQSLNHLANSTFLIDSLPGESEGASSRRSVDTTPSRFWSSRPGRFSMGYDVDWNIGEGF